MTIRAPAMQSDRPRFVQGDAGEITHHRESSCDPEYGSIPWAAHGREYREEEHGVVENVRWAIIGAGTISQTFAAGVTASRTGELVAVGSRNQETADLFGEQFGIPRRYAGYAAVLADPDV